MQDKEKDYRYILYNKKNDFFSGKDFTIQQIQDGEVQKYIEHHPVIPGGYQIIKVLKISSIFADMLNDRYQTAKVNIKEGLLSPIDPRAEGDVLCHKALNVYGYLVWKNNMFWLRVGPSENHIFSICEIDYDARFWEHRDNVFISPDSQELVFGQDRFLVNRFIQSLRTTIIEKVVETKENHYESICR